MNKAEPNFSSPGTTKASNPDPAEDANSFTGYSPSASALGLQTRWITFAAVLIVILLVLAALAGAWWQAPRPFTNPQQAMFASGNPDWWRHPLESNPALRLPAIQGNLRGVHALADGKVWVAGEDGLILNSADGGRQAVLGALIIPLLLGKGLAVYGLNYLDLFKRLLPQRGQVEGKEAVGTMENFRNQFCNLTQALDGRLVLFIDDLDRCDCATVREVLELVNYLVSVGQCFIVLGMAMEHVACCIEPKTPNQETDGYAVQYLKKLINIEVPVPKADLDGIRAMLESQSKSSERPPDSQPARRWVAWIVSLLVLAALTWGMHATWSTWQPDVTPKTFLDAPAETAAVQAESNRLGGPAVTQTRVETEAAKSRQQPVGLMPAITSETSLWNTLLSLLALATLIAGATWVKRDAWLDWLHRHGILQAIRIQLGGAERKRDTPAFRAALESWHKVIVAGDPTPRGIKRFVNRVRFLAMMEQALDSDQIPEGVLVGLAALHHAKVELSALDVIDQTSGVQPSQGAEAEGEQTEPAFPLNLQDAIQEVTQNTPDWPPSQKHIERFLHMIEFMHVR